MDHLLSLATLFPALLAVLYAALLVLLAARDRQHVSVGARRYLLPTLLVAGLAAAAQLLPEQAHRESLAAELFVGDLAPPSAVVLLTDLMLVLFGMQSLRYLQRPVTPWAVAGLTWWAAQAILLAFPPGATADLPVGEAGWLRELDATTATGLVFLGGWGAGTVWLLGAAFLTFYDAHLPEVANRALFWAIVIPLVWIGAVLGTNDRSLTAKIGWCVQFFGLLGAFYSVVTHRVFNVRRTLRWVALAALMTIITTAFAWGLLLGGVELERDNNAELTVIGTVAVMAALAYLMLGLIIRQVIRYLDDHPTTGGLSPLLRHFSEEVAGIVDLDQLLSLTNRTVSYVLHARRAGVLLVTDDDAEGITLEARDEAPGDAPPAAQRLRHDSPILQHFLNRRTPLLQYDLDFGRAYTLADPAERAFFAGLRMSVYAPVFVQGRLVGLVCCGAKTSDDAFTRHDLEVLMTLANHVGGALRTARLVDDLRRREAEQARLNRALSTTKEQLEKLDSVKTDFITVASHELRTPLAQIRGYTDILDVMNDDGTLDEDQIAGMVSSLRKAADRLEDLIGAMLDVSQLDVNAMDLVFAEVRLETVMRMAIEPLTEAIKHRKLMLSARHLRSLPPIQADQQRLVQAFRNVISNAIKFTPDGGRIDITGRMQGDEIVITVQDTGIGIDESNHELIFEKFFRVQDPKLHSSGATKFMGGGPGLGLTIARGVIEGHGGRIWVSSPGYDAEALPGSTFTITLPLHPPAGTRRVLPFELAGMSGQLTTARAGTPASRPFDETRVAMQTPPKGLTADLTGLPPTLTGN